MERVAGARRSRGSGVFGGFAWFGFCIFLHFLRLFVTHLQSLRKHRVRLPQEHRLRKRQSSTTSSIWTPPGLAQEAPVSSDASARARASVQVRVSAHVRMCALVRMCAVSAGQSGHVPGLHLQPSRSDARIPCVAFYSLADLPRCPPAGTLFSVSVILSFPEC